MTYGYPTRLLLGGLVLLAAAGCVKEKNDFMREDTPDATTIEGVVTTSGGEPLAGVELRVDYRKHVGFHYALTRHKARATTDADGRYRLVFALRDGELQEEEGAERSFSLTVDLKRLPADRYLLPVDQSAVLAPDSPRAEADRTAAPQCSYLIRPERNGHDRLDFRFPRKRMLRIVLTGYEPAADSDRFEVGTLFPWGAACDTADKPLDTPSGLGRSGFCRYVALRYEEAFEVPCALDEENLLRIERTRDGRTATEEQRIFVTAHEPAELLFRY